MAQELIVKGLATELWDGRYIMLYNTLNSNCDVWKHETEEYYIFRDSWYWMISKSMYYLDDTNLKSMKLYTQGSSPVGSYYIPESLIKASPDKNADITWESFP